MDQGMLVLGVLVLALVAIAVFSYTSGGIPQGPLATSPNPDAEFGVVREKKSFFRRVRPSPSNTGSSERPPPPVEEDTIKSQITLRARSARSRDVAKEYIQLSYSSRAETPVNISGWTVSNARGESYSIGRVTTLPGLTSTPNLDQLVLPPGSTVNIITGSSPRGESFRINKCVAYFKQFASFTPSLPSSCPRPRSEPGQDAFSDRCYKYVQGLSACRMILSPPLDIDNRCREYINETVSYNGCITNHKRDADFYENAWWVYLGRPKPIWSDIRETITLKDERGTVVKTLSYD